MHRKPFTSASSAAAALVALSVGAYAFAQCGGPHAATILVNHDASLTSYVPSSKTGLQDLRPNVLDRAVSIEGAPRASFGYSAKIAGNPFGNPMSGSHVMQGGVKLHTGGYSAMQVDLSLPAPGFRVTVSRSHSSLQVDSGSSSFVSDGPQGKNWGNHLFMELVMHDDDSNASTLEVEDMAYIIAGPDRYIELRRSADDCDTFRGVNGTSGVLYEITDASWTAEVWRYVDGSGQFFDFIGFDGASSPCEGQLWRVTDPATNVAYFGHSTDVDTAITSGFDAAGLPTDLYDTAGRLYSFTYSSGNIGGAKRLAQVKAEKDPGGTPVEVGRVDYHYYGDGDTYDDGGGAGDLKTVTVTTPLTDSGVNSTRWTYYRYGENTYNATTNPHHTHSLKAVFDSEGLRRYDYDDSQWDAASNLFSEDVADIKQYASAFFEQDSSRRIVTAFFNGECGCGGGTNGEYTLTYETNSSYSDTTGYDTVGSPALGQWATRVVVAPPGSAAHITQYLDEVGQALSRVQSDGAPGSATDFWATDVHRNSDGQVIEIRTPANITYTHAASPTFSASTSAGLIQLYVRETTGDATGFIEHVKHQKGTSGSEYYDTSSIWVAHNVTYNGEQKVAWPYQVVRYVYNEETTSAAPTTGASATTTAATMWTGDGALRPKKVVTYHPLVSTAKNGPGTTTLSSVVYMRKDGTIAFNESTDGIFNYTRIDSNGQVQYRIRDAQTNHSTDFASGDDPGTDFGISESSSGLHFKTLYTYDDQGRLDETTLPGGRITQQYYSRLGDERLVSVSFPKRSGSTRHSPASLRISNHNGQPSAQGAIAYSGGSTTAALTALIDETDTNARDAVNTGTLARLTTTTYDDAGAKPQAQRVYFDIPTTGWPGTTSNYDETTFGYDDRGNRETVTIPSGTITKSVFDVLNRQTETHIGTVNGGGGDNMVKISATEYDSGNDAGNSYVTKRTVFVVDGTADKRETSFDHDARGRVLRVTNPDAPDYVLNKCNNVGQVIASAIYKDSVAATEDPTTHTTNRVSLNRSYYDEQGRVYETRNYEIVQSTGAINTVSSVDQYLATSTWYEESGRVAKVAGSQIVKTTYDRIGRVTDTFVLASDNDTNYHHAVDDVSGDVVMVQNKTVYDNDATNPTGNVLMRVSYERNHDDTGTGLTGELDTNADNDDEMVTMSDVDAFVQITAMWYDNLDRNTTTAAYGTNSGSNFTYGSAPTTSTTSRMVTTTTFNDDGTVKETTQEGDGTVADVVTRFEYDDAGRQITVIQNYINGTPSGATGDDDVHTRYVYSEGLRTEVWHDVDGDGAQDTADDALTRYAYGTTKGTSAGDSKIATGHLLQQVKYPDSTSSTDVVSYAYNAQSQPIWVEDQSGNVHEYDYDDRGRLEHDRVTTIDTETVTDAETFNDDVLRISTAYDERGMVSTVTQYDNATVGSGSVVNEVKYTYNDWGRVSKFEQDGNSTVATGDSLLFDTDYGYETEDNQMVRLDTKTLPDGAVVTYESVSTGGNHDGDLGRTTRIKVGTTVVAAYQYVGTGRTVETDLAEAGITHAHFSAGSTYDRLDVFGRVENQYWEPDNTGSSSLIDFQADRDVRGNIEVLINKLHMDASGNRTADVSFTRDDLNRLTDEKRGYWDQGTSTLTNATQDLDWTLNQRGDGDVSKHDRNADTDYDDTINSMNEYNDDRTYNLASELTARDTDDDGTDDVTLEYDNTGNLTKNVIGYEYDAWGRLTGTYDTTSSPRGYHTQYAYDGIGRQISFRHPKTGQTIQSGDPTYHKALDAGGRILNVYRDSDSDPKERYVYHAAGWSSPVLRERDTDAAWDAATTTAVDERNYYLPDFRGNIAGIIDDDGNEQIEQVHYNSTGDSFLIPAGDLDGDGDVDSADQTIFTGLSSYDIRGDLDLDGDNDSNDKTALATIVSDSSLGSGGYGTLSQTGTANRTGWAAYEKDYWFTVVYSTAGGSYDTELGMSLASSSSAATLEGALACLIECQDLGLTGPELADCIWACVSSPLPPPPPPAAPTITVDPGCDRDWLKDCANEQTVLTAIAQYEQACQGVIKNVTIECVEDPHDGTFGWWCCLSNVIKMTPRADCFTLAEEILHAADQCADNTCEDDLADCGNRGTSVHGCLTRGCADARASSLLCCDPEYRRRRHPSRPDNFSSCLNAENVGTHVSCRGGPEQSQAYSRGWHTCKFKESDCGRPVPWPLPPNPNP